MDMREVPLRPTADLLKEFIMGGHQDTALGGLIRSELKDRGVDALETNRIVLSLISMVAAEADGLCEPERNDDELDYCAGLEPGSWCEDKEEDHE